MWVPSQVATPYVSLHLKSVQTGKEIFSFPVCTSREGKCFFLTGLYQHEGKLFFNTLLITTFDLGGVWRCSYVQNDRTVLPVILHVTTPPNSS